MYRKVVELFCTCLTFLCFRRENVIDHKLYDKYRCLNYVNINLLSSLMLSKLIVNCHTIFRHQDDNYSCFTNLKACGSTEGIYEEADSNLSLTHLHDSAAYTCNYVAYVSTFTHVIILSWVIKFYNIFAVLQLNIDEIKL